MEQYLYLANNTEDVEVCMQIAESDKNKLFSEKFSIWEWSSASMEEVRHTSSPFHFRYIYSSIYLPSNNPETVLNFSGICIYELQKQIKWVRLLLSYLLSYE